MAKGMAKCPGNRRNFMAGNNNFSAGGENLQPSAVLAPPSLAIGNDDFKPLKASPNSGRV